MTGVSQQPYSSDMVKQMIWVSKNDNDADILCDACLDDFYDEEKKDDLVICEKCNVSVHQSCYGHGLLENFPQDAWYCERCIELMKQEQQNQGSCDPKQFMCLLCSDLKGIIVKTNIGWVHLTCVNWMPEIWFTDEALKNHISGEITKERTNLVCSYCKGKNKKKVGCCIQCDYKDCPTSFHVRCAIEQELIKSWDEMDDHMVDDKVWDAYIFCKKHNNEGVAALASFGREGISGMITDKKQQKQSRITKQIRQRQKDIDQTAVEFSSDGEDDAEEYEENPQEDIIDADEDLRSMRDEIRNQRPIINHRRSSNTGQSKGKKGGKKVNSMMNQAFQGMNNITEFM